MIIITIISSLFFLVRPIYSQEISPSTTPSTTPPPLPIINEIFPNPEGEGEWVELFNPTDQTISLESYYIRDNTQSNKISLENYSLPPQSYYLVEFSRDILNNTSPDSVNLFDQNHQIVDQVAYQSTIKNLSLSLYHDLWCFTQPSPNQPNNSCYQPTTPPSPTPLPTSIPPPSPTAIPLPSSTPALKPPTQTPTPTPKPPSSSPSPSPSISITPSPFLEFSAKDFDINFTPSLGDIQGVSTQSSPSSRPSSNLNWFPLVLIFLGSFLLLIPLLLSKLKHDPDGN